jgi:hypothetical protein
MVFAAVKREGANAESPSQQRERTETCASDHRRYPRSGSWIFKGSAGNAYSALPLELRNARLPIHTGPALDPPVVIRGV